MASGSRLWDDGSGPRFSGCSQAAAYWALSQSHCWRCQPLTRETAHRGSELLRLNCSKLGLLQGVMAEERLRDGETEEGGREAKTAAVFYDLILGVMHHHLYSIAHKARSIQCGDNPTRGEWLTPFLGGRKHWDHIGYSSPYNTRITSIQSPCKLFPTALFQWINNIY